MYELKYTSKFKKDLKTCRNRNYNLELLERVIDKLRIPEPLNEKNRDHGLQGNYINFRECHIAPDWLLVYRYDGEYLELARTGTHSDLFKK